MHRELCPVGVCSTTIIITFESKNRDWFPIKENGELCYTNNIQTQFTQYFPLKRRRKVQRAKSSSTTNSQRKTHTKLHFWLYFVIRYRAWNKRNSICFLFGKRTEETEGQNNLMVEFIKLGLSLEQSSQLYLFSVHTVFNHDVARAQYTKHA